MIEAFPFGAQLLPPRMSFGAHSLPPHVEPPSDGFPLRFGIPGIHSIVVVSVIGNSLHEIMAASNFSMAKLHGEAHLDGLCMASCVYGQRALPQISLSQPQISTRPGSF